MKKKFRKSVLALASLMALTSCGSTINAEAAYVENNEDNISVIAATATPGGKGVVGTILSFVGETGKKLFQRQLVNWGLDLLNIVFKSCGLDFLSSDTPDYTEYFEEINDQLAQIQETLKQIQTGMEQQEAARIMDNFRQEFSTLKTSIDPIVKGLASCADRENAASKIVDDDEREAAQAALLAEEEEFYEKFIKNLKYTNSFAEKVISLSNLVVAPSSNGAMSLMRCFTVTSFDIPGVYAWDSMRIDSTVDFLGYITTTLLKAASIARYEITYRYSRPDASEAEKAFWVQTNEDLANAVESALDVLQAETNAALDNQNDITNGVFTHVATGISVNRRLGATSMDTSVAHNLMSYGKSIWVSKGRKMGWNYYRYLLNGSDNKLFEAMIKDYAAYIKGFNYSSSEFTFMDYLGAIGFTAKDELSSYNGLFWKMNYHHEGSALTDEYDYFDVDNISKEGKKVSSRTCYIKNPVWRSLRYEKGEAFSYKFLVFLKPNSDFVWGKYSEQAVNNVYAIYDKLPYEFKYDDAVNSDTLGYCDPSW